MSMSTSFKVLNLDDYGTLHLVQFPTSQRPCCFSPRLSEIAKSAYACSRFNMGRRRDEFSRIWGMFGRLRSSYDEIPGQLSILDEKALCSSNP